MEIFNAVNRLFSPLTEDEEDNMWMNPAFILRIISNFILSLFLIEVSSLKVIGCLHAPVCWGSQRGKRMAAGEIVLQYLSMHNNSY